MVDVPLLLSRLDKTGDCWTWTGATNAQGYGVIKLGGRRGRTWLVHRWLLGELRGVPLSRGELACHHCDNPPCCRPDHLYVGTSLDNHRDMHARGRFRHANAEKSECKRGHSLTGSNLLVRVTGARACRTCNREYMRRRRAERKAA